MAYELQDDNLALTLQLWAESVMRILVYVYVAGLMAGEYAHKAWQVVRPLGQTLLQPIETLKVE